jgi:outer membrane receptor protein involved in Fe transport
LPVHYSSLEYNTLSLPSAGFNNYFESGELFYRAGLEPEQLRKFELGGELGLWNNRLETTFTYYHDSRDRAIFPFFADTEMTLVNGADITNRGVEAAISFRAYSTDLSWNIKLNFSHNRSKVEKIHVAAEEIPIAGFSDIHKSLIEGQPVGVLVGTRYARNPDGDMIIGSDGYPLVDERTGIIGDPNPDWTAGLQNQLSWKGLALSFLLNLEKGGDSWNGTQNVLNYHGTSALTGQERSIRDYIFPGVNEAGIVNTMTVNFADSDQEMSGNRWVRYGLTGVAEAAIEEASSLWLQEIALHYTVPRYILHDLHLSSIKLSVFARNLLLFTPYQGVDPGSSLFGYEHGRGLDLFNLPGMRSFGLKLQLGL